MAGETRFEHATAGFGDRDSTVELLPYEIYFKNIARLKFLVNCFRRFIYEKTI